MLHMRRDLGLPQLYSPDKSRRQHKLAAAPHHPVHVELATACSCIRACCVHDACGNLLCDKFQLLLQNFSLQRKSGWCEPVCCGALGDGWLGLVHDACLECAEALMCTHACVWLLVNVHVSWRAVAS